MKFKQITEESKLNTKKESTRTRDIPCRINRMRDGPIYCSLPVIVLAEVIRVSTNWLIYLIRCCYPILYGSFVRNTQQAISLLLISPSSLIHSLGVHYIGLACLLHVLFVQLA